MASEASPSPCASLQADDTHTDQQTKALSGGSMADVLSNVKFSRYLLFNFLFIGSSFLPSVFITNYGARWFAGCNPNGDELCANIEVNYTQLNFYQSLSTSIRGCISFFFAGFVGRVSDAYGRKLFLLLHPILYCLQILPLIIASNFLWYLLLIPLSGLVGASLGLTPMMSAYISDVLPSMQRTLGFSISYGSAGVALLLSSIISLMISIYMTDYINFWLILILYITQTIYIWFFVEESLPDKYIKPLNKKHVLNPLRPLMQITNNRIVFWISVIQFLITFMEVGILNICMVYILTELHVTNNNENYLLMFLFMMSVSFGLFIATLAIIPFSRKYPLDCFWCKRYKPSIAILKNSMSAMPVSMLNANRYRMSLTEQSQSEISTITVNTNQMAGNLTPNYSAISVTDFVDEQQRLQQIQRDTFLQLPSSALTVQRTTSTSHNPPNPANCKYSTDSMLEDIPFDIDEDHEHHDDDHHEKIGDELTATESTHTQQRFRKSPQWRNKYRLFPYWKNKRRRSQNVLPNMMNNALYGNSNTMPLRQWVDYNNLLIGTFLSFLSLLGIGSVAWIHNAVYIALCGICVGIAVGITFPSANGVATNSLRNDEQGKGFGIIYAVKGITSAIAPFVFGIFYSYLVTVNAAPIIFLIGMLLTLFALVIIVFPLRWVLCDQQGAYPKRTDSDYLLMYKHKIKTYNT